MPLVLLTTDAPAEGTAGHTALAVMRGPGKAVDDVIELLDDDDQKRLMGYAEHGRWPMAGDGTIVSELATALGMTGHDSVVDAIAARPPSCASMTPPGQQLTELHAAGRHHAGVRSTASRNGRAFLDAPDALCGRPPRLIEWTGGRRAPGDEVVPADLRVDHVYLVSCKYLSKILHNPSPARLVDGLLTQAPVDDRSDWYQRSRSRASTRRSTTAAAPAVDRAARFRGRRPT